MKFRLVRVLALGSTIMFARVAGAEATKPPPLQSTDAQQPSDRQPAASRCCEIPAGTVVELELVDPASSRTSQIGDKVRLRVAEPLSVDGVVVIPAGVTGVAEVIQASKARMMGKAGELTLGLPHLEMNGQRIGLKRLRYGRSQGSDPSGTLTALNVAAAAAAPIASPVLLFVSGGNIEIKSGARANAVLSASTQVPPFAEYPVQQGGK